VPFVNPIAASERVDEAFTMFTSDDYWGISTSLGSSDSFCKYSLRLLN